MTDFNSNQWLFIVSATLFANLVSVSVVYVIWNLLGRGSVIPAIDLGKRRKRERATKTTTRVEESLNSLVHFATEGRRTNFVSVGRPVFLKQLEALVKDTPAWDFEGAGEIKDSIQSILHLLREWDQLVQKQSVPVERAEIFIQRLEQDVRLLQQNLEAVRRLTLL